LVPPGGINRVLDPSPAAFPFDAAVRAAAPTAFKGPRPFDVKRRVFPQFQLDFL